MDLAPELYCGFFLNHSLDLAQDLEQLREFEALFAEKGYCEETVRAARPNCLNMIVVKLNSGGLLLYCPVQVQYSAPHLSLSLSRESYVLLQTKYTVFFSVADSDSLNPDRQHLK